MNTPMECKRRCKEESDGYAYAGVQDGDLCFCGNDPPPSNALVNVTECNTPCSGDGDMKCGGTQRMNVFATGFELSCSTF